MIQFHEANLVNIIQRRSQQQPDQLAYIFLEDGKTETSTLTYRELDQQAAQMAGHLHTIAQPGDRALLVYPSGLEFVIAFCACLYAGIIAIPVYPPRPNRSLERLQTIAGDAEAATILTTAAMLTNLQSQLEKTPLLQQKTWVTTDALEISEISSFQHQITSESLAFLQYTSGSIGNPKGVMVSHDNLVQNLKIIQTAFELTSESVSVTWLPHYHDMGLVDGVLEPLFTGFLGVIMPSTAFLQQPIRWLQAITKYKATHCGGPSSGYELCCRKISAEQKQSLDLTSWVSAYNGAEPVRAQVLQEFCEAFADCGFEAQYFYPCYGMAEATLMISGGAVQEEPTLLVVDAEALEKNRVVTIAAASDQKSYTLVGCGRGWLDTQIAIADPETLHPCQTDEVGEILVAGTTITQGYWHQQEITAASFGTTLADIDPAAQFFRTGDLGFFHGGELFITGRLKDVIILWGRNYYPQDIEFTVAQCHPALAPISGAAFSVVDDQGEQLVVVQEVERTARRSLDVDEVVKAIREAVAADYDLQVQAIALIRPGSIPKTSSGKIKRRACRQQFLDNQLEILGEWQQPKSAPEPSEKMQIQHSIDQPITEAVIQNWLIEKLAEVLQISPEEIDIDESFAQYGLDSSVMLEITGDLGEWLNYEAEPTLLWEYIDISSLAEYLIEEI